MENISMFSDISEKDFEISYDSCTHTKPISDTRYEFCFFSAGKANLKIGEQNYIIIPETVILIPPDTQRVVTPVAGQNCCRDITLWLAPDIMNRLVWHSSDYNYFVNLAKDGKKYVYPLGSVSFQTVCSKIFDLSQEINTDRYGKETKISLCINEILFDLNRIIYELENTDRQGSSPSLDSSLIQYIENHLTEALTIEQLAKTFYMSRSHILHTFKKKYGITVHQYITKKRLDMCRKALCQNDTVTITKVFQQYGFKDYTSFYRAFKKEYGLSPKQYKSTHTRSV